MTPSVAKMEIMLLDAEVASMSRDEFYIWLTDKGLPQEAVVRLVNITEATALIGNKVVNVGKIIIKRLYEFVMEHPNMAIGMAIGAGLSILISTIPLLGGLLAPIALALGVSLGAIVGHGIDQKNAGAQLNNSAVIQIAEGAIEVAKAFFKLLLDVFSALKNDLIQLS